MVSVSGDFDMTANREKPWAAVPVTTLGAKTMMFSGLNGSTPGSSSWSK
jgi:hypothetical protein